MRTIKDYQNINNSFIVLNENWDYVSKGILKNLRKSVKQETEINNLQDYQIKYPIVWMKGDKTILEVQADYYQHETEEGDKLHGYCTQYYFSSNNVSKTELLQVVNGKHPKNLGYNLQPII
jgi:hypothetical protein